MNGKTLVGFAAIGLALASQVSLADGHRQWSGRYDTRSARDYDYARVLDVDPLVERYRVTEPRHECWDERRYDNSYSTGGSNRSGATLLGGLVGAMIGNQFGHGSDRKVATVAGAVLGGAVGNQVAANRGDDRGYRDDPRAYEVQRCATRHENRYEERIVAYRVTYLYNGRQYHTQLPYDPGERIRVALAVHPAE